MKFNFHGIRFNVFKYFFLFSVAILVLLGFLQVVLIRPYYRNDRITIAQNLSSAIQSQLLEQSPDNEDIADLFERVVNNNACVVIYNDNQRAIYQSDALGEQCLLRQQITYDDLTLNIARDPKPMMDLLDANLTLETTIASPLSGYDMLLYGKKISSDLVNYYLIINSPLDPVESVIDFVLNQYLYIALMVFLIALVIALFLANRLSDPIVKMKKAAGKLAEGNYDVHFTDQKTSFSEINDLGKTLDDTTEQLSKMDELRKDLMANVSHDIKTPLTMIKAYAEMIKDISGDDPAKRDQHLDVIIKESDYLNRLVTDMQELSKLQAGYLQLHRDNFELANCVDHVLELMDELFKSRNLEVVWDHRSAIAYGDETKIEQVIYNFLSNAVKHSPDGSHIYIRIIDDEEFVRLEVQDEGEGIAQDDLPYIWDRYYKIDKSFSRNMESSGLGLAIVKEILNAHHARFGVLSKEHEGATFYFELPKEYEEENPGLPTESAL